MSGGGPPTKKHAPTAPHAPRHYILGWSNLEKIQSLEQEQRQVAIAAQNQATVITVSAQRQDAATARATKAGHLQSFRAFGEIDWRSAVKRGAELEERRQDPEQSSDKIKKLQEQLRDVELHIQTTDEKKTDTAVTGGGVRKSHKEKSKR